MRPSWKQEKEATQQANETVIVNVNYTISFRHRCYSPLTRSLALSFARAHTSSLCLSLSLSFLLLRFLRLHLSSFSLSVCLCHRRISLIFSLSTSQQRRSLLTHDRLKMRHATSWHKDQSGDDAFGWRLQTSSPTTTVDNVLPYSSFSISPRDIINIQFTTEHHQRTALDSLVTITLRDTRYWSDARLLDILLHFLLLLLVHSASCNTSRTIPVRGI